MPSLSFVSLALVLLDSLDEVLGRSVIISSAMFGSSVWVMTCLN